ncbi:1-deoxy-D-xylulose-5-phosphate synthase [Streptomyces sp. TRM72054]|uniref:1-deoxy-D-xylulose-5-phosphate synthase n=1 Tax=Streptomyces sp. TRM72054 TaxID=2870562 RepID=UPI001C8C1961|nr:1-deoxy-D-xylulose-5-phosphate synthase [Streptomyces sp. TRM72054]MBX9399559.1 1-deoxy-D-xylulose-5-phosphate synthase [Streptomyces sp. TRM72054]
MKAVHDRVGETGSQDGILEALADPARLRAMTFSELVGASEHIRSFLVDRVCRSGGHLGPNLGVVELTIALHRVFDSPRDRILFDTGHQAYVHKLLTGRWQAFDHLRQAGGLSGYPSQAESVHDVIENSHASTALSYAHGLARAYALQASLDRAVAVVVGDGAMTGGMCWEALNNIGATDQPVVIVLNDNGRSYAPTNGAFARHLAALRGTGVDGNSVPCEPGYQKRSLFEAMGITYLGPVDGHDVRAVEEALRHARRLRRPTLVHCVTVKGNGYAPAVADDKDCLHAVGVVDPATGMPTAAGKNTWTDVFSQEITAIGAERSDIVCLTASMLHPVGLAPFARAFPDRVLDVGIAEQHAVTSAAGLALGGLHPVVAVYATFLNRAFDQVLMDVALHRLPVTFVLDRAGVTGPDGASHHGMWDLSALSAVPGLRVAAPRDAIRLKELLREAVNVTGGPTAVRFPKAAAGSELAALQRRGHTDILAGTGRGDVLLVGIGPMAAQCLEAAQTLEAEGISTTVADPRWVIPADPALLELIGRHHVVITVEDGNRIGGAGSMLTQAATDAGITTPVHNLGLPRRFLPHAARDELLNRHGFRPDALAYAAHQALAGVGPYHHQPDQPAAHRLWQP